MILVWPAMMRRVKGEAPVYIETTSPEARQKTAVRPADGNSAVRLVRYVARRLFQVNRIYDVNRHCAFVAIASDHPGACGMSHLVVDHYDALYSHWRRFVR